MLWAPKFIKRRPVLWTVVVFFIFTLPAGVDAWLSLWKEWEAYRATEAAAVTPLAWPQIPDWLTGLSSLVGVAAIVYIALVNRLDRRNIRSESASAVPAPSRAEAPALGDPPPTTADSFTTAALLRVAHLWSAAQSDLWNFADHTFRAARDKGRAENFVVTLINAHLMGNRQKDLMTMVTNTLRNKRRLTVDESKEGAALLMEALDCYYALANALAATSGFLVPADAPCSEEYGKVRERGIKLADELARLEHTELNRLSWRQDVRTVLLECNKPDGE